MGSEVEWSTYKNAGSPPGMRCSALRQGTEPNTASTGPFGTLYSSSAAICG